MYFMIFSGLLVIFCHVLSIYSFRYTQLRELIRKIEKKMLQDNGAESKRGFVETREACQCGTLLITPNMLVNYLSFYSIYSP